MKAIINILCSVIFFSLQTTAQDTLVLQPNSFCGEDAYIWELSNQSGQYGTTESNNYGHSKSFIAHEWTWNSDPGRRKSLLNFDFSHIPPGSIVLEAYLDLYGFPDSPDNGHSSLSGSNAAVLKRITGPWNESTVTWNTQPTTTDENQVFLSESTSTGQDYLDINITNICQDIVNNPLESAGIMFSIIEPDFYRAMVFASSDHLDSTKHPRLRVIYLPSSSPELISTFNLPDTTICGFEGVTYSAFKPCASYKWSNGTYSSETIINAPGTYWVEVTNNAGTFVDTFHVSTADCSFNLELPNVFTPNIDGINDYFTPVKSNGIVDMKTVIINRWGQVVFETSDPNIMWGGKTESGLELAAGVYFWMIDFKALNGTEGTIHGHVNIFR